MSRKNIWIVLEILVLLFFCGCKQKMEQDEVNGKKPDVIQNLENLISYPLNSVAPYTVKLERITTFGSNEDAYINGYIIDVSIDKKGNVYLLAGKPQITSIYVFNKDGSFLKQIDMFGRGPGEFEKLSSIEIINNRLYAFGAGLQKVAIFSLSDFKLIKDIIIDRYENDVSMPSILRASGFFVTEKETILVKFESNTFSNQFRFIYLYRLLENGALLPHEVLKLDSYHFYLPENTQTSKGIAVAYPMPFSRSSIMAVTDNENIYTAWTEDFLLKKFNVKGKYQEAFYYPFKKSVLSVSDMKLSEAKRKLIEGKQVPDTWPALNRMVTDDENHLWVSTITDSDSTFDWWVLNEHGELLANFARAGEKSARGIMWEPIIKIKNGHFYTQERNIRQNVDQIVKYKIEFIEH